jgi:hypothetical protein
LSKNLWPEVRFALLIDYVFTNFKLIYTIKNSGCTIPQKTLAAKNVRQPSALEQPSLSLGLLQGAGCG